MSPSEWGPAVWRFMHVMVSTVKEEHFAALKFDMLHYVRTISCNLPCPTCSEHAKQYWSSANIAIIKTKLDLMNAIWHFHNQVNSRRQVPPFPHEHIEAYKKGNILRAFKYFRSHYKTRGNLKLMNDEFSRTLIVTHLSKWLLKHHQKFNYT
jgi:hypothetical protein